MRRILKSLTLSFCLVGLLVLTVPKAHCQNEGKPKNYANYLITLKYFTSGKIQKEISLVSSSNSFSTSQSLSSKYLIFSGSIALIPNIMEEDFLLKYEVYLRQKMMTLHGVQQISGMRGLKQKEGETSNTSNSCRGVVKLKNGQELTIYTLSNPVGSSKKKVEPELEFVISVSKMNSKKKRK